MVLYLGLLIFSFVISSIAVVPFINLLYSLKFRRRNQLKIIQKTETYKPFIRWHKLHNWKSGTPVGGGLLVIGVVTLLYLLLFPLMSKLGVYISTSYPIVQELQILFFTFLSFGALGLYDDVIKFFGIPKQGIFGIRTRTKFIIQWLLAIIIAVMLYQNLHIQIVNIPLFGVVNLGLWYIPFAAFVIVTFVNAFNITDGLDGLSCGLFLFALGAFWVIAGSSLDTVLSTFIALFIGSMMAFLYFNVFPARVWLGDVGALSFGATLAVIGLLLGKVVAVFVVSGIFLVDGGSSLIQILSWRIFNRRVFEIAPLHHLLEIRGWEEPKIVMRAWLAGLMLAIFGLWLALL
ncbi:MAG: Phospho-N-acetylmuramoyl-pentapeptide-transferase [Microgenomates group bacterium GW2011_GWA2_44_7]|uniref:Phospho-N-acetylmuramoyl-pentapeptide-transferase n=1 Tax=Candidatus Woesebacteria bacterium GW2011_GWA1_43_12 TaxID=1618557 RepID=A0A0G1FUV3_9BACT|nr:MAG: Phospho-N-acetylmuramoyl-pentapeptide-transferase [Candidatus Woesebacteria bacterium GW2011_GWA1_43_12]KKT75857.1 MAG: Phospho-N-acetylmuramoyl-pentapeptide-transferase [Microgenomates group bacterium GW2011_GWA2_44_7]KKT78523.1 MAG: Phospho-N-acetylmuramoyl-pentapeptide-transferase [Microgenomates group bacterium GW2011_GWB1_44_8]